MDNRKSNLRVCYQKENARNAQVQKRGNSRYKGVHWREDKQKFQAYITVNRKRQYLGHFNSEEEAALAYNKAALEKFGEFALINELKGGIN